MTAQLSYPALNQVFARFAEAEPHPRGELHHTNAFTLLVAVALSAQATDAGVNKATAKLFQIDQRQLKPLRDKREQEGQAKACNKGGDQGRFVGQCFTVLSGPLCHLQQGHVRFREKCQKTMG